MAKRRGRARIVVPLILLALVAAYLGAVTLSGRRDVSPAALLLPETVATSPLGAGRAGAATPRPGGGAMAGVSRTWSFASGGKATQLAHRYVRPLNAEYHYVLDHPKDEYERGFEERDASDQYDSPHADRSTIFCATGSRTGCRDWIYWGRYGQYLVRLDLGRADADIPIDDFVAFLKTLDARIAAAS
jgi:hypothetical protein